MSGRRGGYPSNALSQRPSVNLSTPGSAVARTNAFEVTWEARKNVYHYDAISSFERKDGKIIELKRRESTELIDRLQTTIEPSKFTPRGAYDGAKNLFTAAKLPFRKEVFNVQLKADSRAPNPTAVSVTVSFVAFINAAHLTSYLGGQAVDANSNSFHALNMLNMFVRAGPSMTYPHTLRSFFAEQDTKRIPGFELRRGYFQSIRPAPGKIINVVDIATGVIIPKSGLASLFQNYLQLHNSNQLTSLNANQLRKLQLYAKGIKFIYTLESSQRKRRRTVVKLIDKVGAVMFENSDGQKTNVKEYFLKTHQKNVLVNGLGVKVGAKADDAVFPIEFCETVGDQIFNQQLQTEAVQDVLQFSTQSPDKRLEAITKSWQLLQYETSPFLKQAGISISPKPISVHGQVLQSPEMQCDRPFSIQKPGQWDMRGKKYTQAMPISGWGILNVSGQQTNPAQLQKFLHELQSEMVARGMNVQSPTFMEQCVPNQDQVLLKMQEACSKWQLGLLYVILQENAGPTYEVVKRAGDIDLGLVTQCIKWKRSFNQSQNFNQYINNLLLKVNVKVNGTNSHPLGHAIKNFGANIMMIMGADVSHPGPGSQNRPSITSVVASYDQFGCRYKAFINLQEPRQEIITDIGLYLELAVQNFLQKTRYLPRQILFYRDGVSEGEFDTVTKYEIGAIDEALKRVYASAPRLPDLTFVVVGKRHHTRFFPGQGLADGTGNCMAGFLVDKDITHPQYEDFYLLSHPGLKGTSRPSHYTVLKNEAFRGQVGRLQETTYTLCHCYSRSTRSVSVPAPVYYADLVCRRAKFHFDQSVDLDALSNKSGSGFDLEYFRKRWNPVHADMENRMYFV